MKIAVHLKTVILSLLITLPLFWFGLSPEAQAVVPPPDGGYPGANTAEGQSALLSLTSGTYNTAVGILSLKSDTSGSYNTAVGAGTLVFNTADENTATGFGALLTNTTGDLNTATGTLALFANTDGFVNTAIGYRALFSNTLGVGNTANGAKALADNTEGSHNTAIGYRALFINIGSFNTASGDAALVRNTLGEANTAIGGSALNNNNTGDENTALGDNAGFNVITASHVICIGAGVGDANVSNKCFIGQIYTNVQPQVGIDPDLVTINSSGRLGRANVSSRRYKHDIKPMENASEAIYALKPASFRYHKQYDPTQTIAFGLIAEEVAEVNPQLVGRNPEGQPESVRYEQINAMLLNEFLKEHRKGEEQDRKIEEQETTIAELKSGMKALAATVNEQASQLREVSAQLQMANPAMRVVAENP